MLKRITFLCCLLCCGCGESTTKPSGDSSPSATSSMVASTRSSPQPGLSVPRLSPKPVVWLKDWSGPQGVGASRREAQELMRTADRLKSQGKYAQAENYYDKSVAADAKWGYPSYQLACNFALWGKSEEALGAFRESMNRGFDDLPTALTDDELGEIRTHPDFNKWLGEIRDRYVAGSAERVGQALAIAPQTDLSNQRWPVILLLHGYGDSNENYVPMAQDWADLGFIAVAVPGSVPMGDGRFQWTMKSTQPTQEDLQAIVQSSLLKNAIDPRQVFLLGFSQGALHSMLLTAERPDLYAGVVGLSPGGSMGELLATPVLKKKAGTRCAFIHGQREPHAPLVKVWSRACDAAGWKFRTSTHVGGHQFPPNWEQDRPGIAKFLLAP